jgi:YbbR domain-containing protein
MPKVEGIKYLAPADVPISQSSFRASIDLTSAKVNDSEYNWVKVQLVPTDPRIQILDYEPQQIRVTLDPVITKTVEIHVEYGQPPAGLIPGTPVLSSSTVDVSGAAAIVGRIAYAEASVRIDSSGLDVSQDPVLVAIDASGAVVDNVTFAERTVHVAIQVGSKIRSETVPVFANIKDDPAPGYYMTSVTVTPSVVSVRGQADALSLLKNLASTTAISISGATSDISVKVNLDLPTGVTSDTTGPIQVVIHVQSPQSTRNVSVGLAATGTRPDRTYTLSAPSVTVTLGGATAALNALDVSTLYATVNVDGLDIGTHVVTVTFTAPAGIKVLPITPAKITVVVAGQPVATPTPTPTAS